MKASIIETVLNFGSLPKIFSLEQDSDREDFLESYALTYLNEEVWAEHLVRDLDSFRKFLEISAQSNGKLVNYLNIARDVRAHEKTVKKYFQILEDTLIGFMLEPYHSSVRKRMLKSPKFYLFDTGIKRALARSLRSTIVSGTSAYGEAFEHFVIIEAMRLNEYHKKHFKFSYFATKDGGKIDLIVERPGLNTVLIEIKSSKQTDERDTSYLRSILKDFKNAEAFCLSQDVHEGKLEGVFHLPWQKALKEMDL